MKWNADGAPFLVLVRGCLGGRFGYDNILTFAYLT